MMKNSQTYNPYDDIDEMGGRTLNQTRQSFQGKSFDNLKSRSLAKYPGLDQLVTKN